jgi:hypothetical protein
MRPAAPTYGDDRGTEVREHYFLVLFHDPHRAAPREAFHQIDLLGLPRLMIGEELSASA